MSLPARLFWDCLALSHCRAVTVVTGCQACACRSSGCLLVHTIALCYTLILHVFTQYGAEPQRVGKNLTGKMIATKNKVVIA